MNKELIPVKAVYFKESGKMYVSATGLLDPDHYKDCIYPSDFGRRMRDRKECVGLNSGYWAGHFMIETDYPELCLGSYDE